MRAWPFAVLVAIATAGCGYGSQETAAVLSPGRQGQTEGGRSRTAEATLVKPDALSQQEGASRIREEQAPVGPDGPEKELQEARARIKELERALEQASRAVVVEHGSPFAEYLSYKTVEAERAGSIALRKMSALLDDIPVHVTPEEGDWILKRCERGDWSQFPGHADPIKGGIDGALLHFLGPQRVLQDGGPQPWFYRGIDEDEWVAIFGSPRPKETAAK